MNKNIFIIAGEKSGDDLGKRLMSALLEIDHNIQFHGIGGPSMEQLGLISLFPMNSLSVMGFMEVLPKIFELNAKINLTVKTIIDLKPDIIITIDLPGFNYRVVAKLRKSGYRGKIFHYVAPSVWAYKPDRAKKFAQIFDHMICILPFEEKYFKEAGMKTSYIGNPVIEQAINLHDKTNDKVERILICPGSRKQEIKTLLPIFRDALEILAKKHRFQSMILSFPENLGLMGEILKQSSFEHELITPDEQDKLKIINICDLALSKSGTVTTEIALAGVPMIVAHKVNFISYFIIKRLIKISHICLVNIIAGKEIVPELIQNNCNASPIAALLEQYILDKNLRQKQVSESHKIFKTLGLGEKLTPSQKLARLIIAEI